MRALIVIVLLSACGPRTAHPERGPEGRESKGAPPDAPPPDAPLPLSADPPTLAARLAAMIDGLATALDGTTDCAALAERARTVLTEHREARDAAAEAARRGRARELDAALETHADAIAAAVARMRPALAACAGDTAFAEAITPFDL